MIVEGYVRRPLVTGFPANFHGHCCRCDRPIRLHQQVVKHGHGYIHIGCASDGER